MPSLRDLKGLKFPDDYVIRWFFKRGLNARASEMLELGCGSGANLALAQAYGWGVTGVDLDDDALAGAAFNLGAGARLIQGDLGEGLPLGEDERFSAVMIPNFLYYLRAEAAQALLAALKVRLAPGAEVFVRTRTPEDHRCGRGEEIAPFTWRLATPETGEAGLINRFYPPAELEALLAAELGLTEAQVMTCAFDNPQSGVMVRNADVIVWGRAG